MLTLKLLTSSRPCMPAPGYSIWLQSYLICLGVYWFKSMTSNHIKLWKKQMSLNSFNFFSFEAGIHFSTFPTLQRNSYIFLPCFLFLFLYEGTRESNLQYTKIATQFSDPKTFLKLLCSRLLAVETFQS